MLCFCVIIPQCDFVYLCALFQVEHSFNYLEIQGIACNKPTQVLNIVPSKPTEIKCYSAEHFKVS